MEAENVYSYKVVRIDAGMVALRRMVVYFCILLFIISTALVILFILFERYMALIACGVMYVLSVLVLFISGRGGRSYIYRFSNSSLEIENERKDVFVVEPNRPFSLKPADHLDEDDPQIVKYCFRCNKVSAVKNIGNASTNDI